jgi:serine/threonine protein kinase
MGEVYRATDTRLGRAVAIKILPQAFSSDPDRLARFEREAKILASLNHPNIAQRPASSSSSPLSFCSPPSSGGAPGPTPGAISWIGKAAGRACWRAALPASARRS